MTSTETLQELAEPSFEVEPLRKLGLADVIPAYDRAELHIATHCAPVDCPVKHTFTPGLYARECFMPAGARVSSKIHKTEHQFIVSQGVVDVLLPDGTVETIIAPHHGITRPGTKRLLIVHTDCVWTTFHPTPLTTVEEIEDAIIEPHVNPLLMKNPANIKDEAEVSASDLLDLQFRQLEEFVEDNPTDVALWASDVSKPEEAKP